MSERTTRELVGAAAEGDPAAWRDLVARYGNVVWSVARAHRLSEADAADVAQTTWLNLAQQLPRVREPDRMAGWLATTARREALRLLAVRQREAFEPAEIVSPVDGPEALAVRGDTERALWRALHRLPARCVELLRLMAFSPELSYAQAARALGIQAASVGRTKGRCLAVLRRRLECDGLVERVAR
ncbi:MAG TPA: sigma-70 family RNA polymerase sigma factor [Pseudonocardiaceae bacterium]|nr:sigma-70 family RNA polymerase sigma factor [Pseudonocardiaceae bacterium]